MPMKTDLLENGQLVTEDQMSEEWFVKKDWIALGEKPRVPADVCLEVWPDARKLIETFVAYRNR